MVGDPSRPGLDSVAQSFGLTVLGSKDDSSTSKNEIAEELVDGEAKEVANGETSEIANGEVNGVAHRDKPPPKASVGSLDTASHIYQGPVDEQGKWTWVGQVPDNVEEAAENKETACHALVVRNKKSSDSRKKFEIDSIVIQSPWLKKALTEILKDYPDVHCGLKRLIFKAPFEPFVHRWGELLEFMKRKHNDKTDGHMNLLFSILNEELSDTIKAFEDYVAHGVITFEHLWTVFQPGAIVISHFHGGTTVAVGFQSGAYEETRCGKVYALTCECIDWSGEYFGRGSEHLQVPAFAGVKPINSLHTYPLSFYPKKEGLRELLIKRGQKFESLTGYQYKEYKGWALGRDREGKQIRLSVTGRIVIDTKSWNRRSWDGERYLTRLSLSGVEEEDAEDRQHIVYPEKGNEVHGMGSDEAKRCSKLKEEHHLICSPRVKGYSLKLKKWLEFFVDLVEEIRWNDRAFQSLVLPEDQKELILSFTESQVIHRETFDDVIQGKGKGIIMLLSGPPGVGKTLTAESVAENMHVPLYMMSAGDLGMNPLQVEETIRETLEMIAKWNAILLLDECDVFLEARSTHDLERNKLVSIFLRVLEYYEGILFLTTNRIDNIDAAFQSRIHVSMAYPELTAESRRHIWANFLNGSAQKHEFTETDLDELAGVQLNGRQIKNVLKTAQLLAARKKCSLKREFVETILAIEKRRPEISQ